MNMNSKKGTALKVTESKVTKTVAALLPEIRDNSLASGWRIQAASVD